MRKHHQLNLPSRPNLKPHNKKTDHNPLEEAEALREELEEETEEAEVAEVEKEVEEEVREVEEAEREEEEENSEAVEVEIEEAEEEEVAEVNSEEEEEVTEGAEVAEVEDSRKVVRDHNTFPRKTLVRKESLRISKRKILETLPPTTSMSQERDKTIHMTDTLELDTERRTTERVALAKEDGITRSPKRKKVEKPHLDHKRKKSRN